MLRTSAEVNRDILNSPKGKPPDLQDYYDLLAADLLENPAYALHCTIIDAVKDYVLDHAMQEPTVIHLPRKLETVLNLGFCCSLPTPVTDHYLGMQVVHDADKFKLSDPEAAEKE